MSRYSSREHVENPEAYERAISNRIKQNRWKTGRAKLLAAIEQDGVEFREWLLEQTPANIRELEEQLYQIEEEYAEGYEVEYRAKRREIDNAYRELRMVQPKYPVFLRESLENWGGLTDGQLAFARRIWTERRESLLERQAERKAERDNAPNWTEGRQEVEGVVLSTKWHSVDIGYGRSSGSLKGFLKLADGRRLYATVPYGTEKGMTVRMRVTVSPADDDPTMGFGKRPSNSVIVDMTEQEQREAAIDRLTEES